MQPTQDKLTELLESHGVKPTQQRLHIAGVLFERRQHLSADDLLARVKAAGVNVSKATVYNTLGLFAEKGLVRTVIVDPNRVFYDSNVAPHHHFFDTSTGELTDFHMADIPVGDLPGIPEGRRVEGVDVIVRIRPDTPPDPD